MRKRVNLLLGCALGMYLCFPVSASKAQQEATVPDATGAASDTPVSAPAAIAFLPDSASPFGDPSLSDDEIAGITMPRLDGPVTPLDEESFDKYYYFHRAGTDVATAFKDISECDGYARGLQSGVQYQQAPYPYTYTMAGAVGGAVGNALAMAIVGSAQKRAQRRVNMRACMSYKGYQRFGLPKDVWEKFNFEEGLNSKSDAERRPLLLQQALVAATANPSGKVLEP